MVQLVQNVVDLLFDSIGFTVEVTSLAQNDYYKIRGYLTLITAIVILFKISQSIFKFFGIKKGVKL